MWPTSADRSTPLLRVGNLIKIPNDLMVPVVANKLDGFTSFRATAVVKLQVNAQPFQAGRLLMSAIPMPTLLQGRAEWLTLAVSLQQAINHVQLDIAKQTEVSLRIPFVSPFNSYDLIHGEYPWAEVNVCVYSKLNSVSAVPLECLFWFHFEDIELGAPTSGAVMAIQQGGRVAPKEVSANQVNRVRAQEEPGIISSIAGTVKGISSSIGNAIPAVSPISGIVNTVADVVGGIAGIFGWSKPLLGKAGCTVIARPTEYFTNADGVDHSHNLSLAAMNVIDVYPGLGGTNMDETSLDFIKKIPQMIGYFRFCNNHKYNDKLWMTYVTPTYYLPHDFKANWSPPVTANENAIPVGLTLSQPTTLHYAISPFGYWTGSLVYTLRFVKTNFHSGRVEISFHPFVSDVNTSRMEYVYRLVIDLRDNSEVSFTVPYISPQPWKRIDSLVDFMQNNPTPQPWSRLGRSITGVLYVRALTPLICATEIIAPDIECVVEARAGDDFRIQAPTTSAFGPFAVAPSVQAIPRQQAGKVYALPGTQETRTSSLEGFTPASITGSESDVNRSDTQNFCAGEQFNSFRQLTRRYAFMRKFILKTWNVYEFFPTTLIRPPALNVGQVSSKQGLITPNITELKTTFQYEYAPSPLSFVSSMYAFYRGGVRLKTWIDEYDIADNKFEVPTLVSARINNASVVEDGARHLVNNYMAPVAYELDEYKRFGEFKMPYYSPTLVSVHWSHNAITQFDQPLVAVEITVSDKVGNADSGSPETWRYCRLATAAADDLDFHLFLGAPPCIPYWRIQANQYPADDNYPPDFYTSEMDVDPCYKLLQQDLTDGQPATGNWPPSSIIKIGDKEYRTQTYKTLAQAKVKDFTVTDTQSNSCPSAVAAVTTRSAGMRSYDSHTNSNKTSAVDAEYQRKLDEYYRKLAQQEKKNKRAPRSIEEPLPPKPPTASGTGRKILSIPTDDESEDSEVERVPDVIDSRPTVESVSRGWRDYILPPNASSHVLYDTLT